MSPEGVTRGSRSEEKGKHNTEGTSDTRQAMLT